MNYLLFSGGSNTGKSSAIYRLAVELTSGTFRKFTVVAGSVPTTFSDFRAVLEGIDNSGKTIRILINSASDTKRIINELHKFYISNLPVDFVISSVRNLHTPRSYFFNKMNIVTPKDFYIEVPLAKLPRGTHRASALIWYQQSVNTLGTHLLGNSPFNL